MGILRGGFVSEFRISDFGVMLSCICWELVLKNQRF